MSIPFYINPATGELELTADPSPLRDSLGKRFNLDQISTRAKTLSPTKSYAEKPTYNWEEGNWWDLDDQSVGNTKILEDFDHTTATMHKDGGRIDMKPGGIVEPGVTHYALTAKETGALEGSKIAKEILDAKKVKTVGHVKELEKWIEANASRYTDVDKFYQDAIKKFDKPKYEGLVRESVQKAQKNVRDPVKAGKHIYIPSARSYVRTGDIGGEIPKGARYNYKNLFELKGGDAGSKIRYVKDMMLINMLEKNPKMIKFAKNLDKVVLNDFKDLSDADRRQVGEFTKKHLKATADKPNLFRSYLNEKYVDFEELRKKNFTYSKGIEADLRNKLKNPNIGDAAKKKIKNTLGNISKTKKYHIDLKNEFPDLFVDKPVKHPLITTGQEQFHFEHAISKGSTAINKLPETYNLRGRYMPSSFNYAKMLNFDNPLVNLMREYRETKNPKLEKQIKDLVNKFNKQSAGYLDNLTVDFERSTGSVIVNDKTPMYKVKDFADYKAQMAKNLKHSQAYLKTIEGGKYAFDEKIVTKVLQQIKNIPKGPGRLKMISYLVAGGVSLKMLNDYGISSAEAAEAQTLETSGKTQEANVIGDVVSAVTENPLKSAAAVVGGDVALNKARLSLKTLRGVDRAVGPWMTPLIGLYTAITGEPPDPTSAANLLIPSFWNSIMKRYNWQDKSADPIKRRIINAAKRGLIPTNLMPIISRASGIGTAMFGAKYVAEESQPNIFRDDKGDLKMKDDQITTLPSNMIKDYHWRFASDDFFEKEYGITKDQYKSNLPEFLDLEKQKAKKPAPVDSYFMGGIASLIK